MCVYCNMGDWAFKHHAPFTHPGRERSSFRGFSRRPGPHLGDWSIEKLEKYLDILKQIRALEEQVGCPCEPNKADYIKLFMERIGELKKKMENV